MGLDYVIVSVYRKIKKGTFDSLPNKLYLHGHEVKRVYVRSTCYAAQILAVGCIYPFKSYKPDPKKKVAQVFLRY